MAILTVEGVYKDGKIELAERPEGVGAGARVIVTFLNDTRAQVPPAAYLPTDPEELERLRQQAFAHMKEGISLGGPPYPKREDLYDRFERSPSEPSSEEQARIEAGKRLMERLNRGIPFDGPPYPKHEELHDRTYRFDGTRNA